MVKKLLATLTTDSQGKATYTYTGTGAGDVKFSAESTNNGSLVSETYSLIDALFYDKGTSGTPDSDWWVSSSNLTLTSDNTGLTASNNTSSTYYLAPNKHDTSTGSVDNLIDWNDFICEFTYVEHTNVQIQTRNASANATTQSLNSFLLSNGDVFKIKYTGGVVTYYKNGTELSLSDTNTGEVMLRLAITNGTLTFKDFKIYPI